MINPQKQQEGTHHGSESDRTGEPPQGVRGLHGGGRPEPRHKAQQLHRAPGAQRGGQEHHPEDTHASDPPDIGHGVHQRVRRRREPQGGPGRRRDRHRDAGVLRLPDPEGDVQVHRRDNRHVAGGGVQPDRRDPGEGQDDGLGGQEAVHVLQGDEAEDRTGPGAVGRSKRDHPGRTHVRTGSQGDGGDQGGGRTCCTRCRTSATASPW